MQRESHGAAQAGTDYSTVGTKEPKSRNKPRPLDAEVGPMGLAASTVLGTSENRPPSEAKVCSYR
jgi:hypothetical protein